MKLPRRKLNRLTEFDYSQPGAYFITACTKDMKWLLWTTAQSSVGARIARRPISHCQSDTLVGARIARPPSLPSDLESQPVEARVLSSSLPDKYELSAYGKAVSAAIESISTHYPTVTVDKYVVMPNHFHLLLSISENSWRAMRAPTISTIVNQMKGTVTKTIKTPIWQKGFHDHVIRNEKSYLRIWKYIDENPLIWADDCYFTNENPQGDVT